MAPFHVFKKKFAQNFNLNYKGTKKPIKWSQRKPVCAPLTIMRMADCNDREDVMNFARRHFFEEEPLRIGSYPIVRNKFDEDFHEEKISKGTTIMAVLPDFNETMVGTLIAAPKCRWELENLAYKHLGDNTKWGSILNVWARAERDGRIFDRYGVNTVLHAYLLSVHKRYRGHDIGLRLIKELAEVGKKRRMEAITIDATSEFASCICQKAGMKLLNMLVYRDHLDEKGYVIFDPPYPHYAMRTYGMRL